MHNQRILIVDDEPDIRGYLAAKLERKGFIAQQADNGHSALESVQNQKPDLIILDVLMPKMDGFELLQKLKSDSRLSDIPVIMLTIKKDRKSLDKGISLGADFYLPKPFTLNNLFDFINLITEESSLT